MHRPFVALAALLLALPAVAAVPQLVAPDDVRELLSSFLEFGDVADATAQAAFERRMQREVPKLLATEGYFSPTVVLRQGDELLRLEVDPGPRSLIGVVDIEIAGDLDTTRRKALLSNWKLKTGQPFRQAEWDAAKQSLLADLLAVDYAGARLLDTRADVDPEARRVDLHVAAETGPRYRFGELEISGLQRYSQELVRRFNHSVTPGDEYREDRLLALQAALQSTPYFVSVSVLLARGDEGSASTLSEDGWLTAPVRVQLRERAPHQVTLGAGYSTNTGARVEAAYRSSDLFGRAWELQTGVRIEQVRQTAYADVFFPPDDRQRRDGVGTAVEDSDIENLGIKRFAVGATRLQRFGSVEQRLNLNWQEERQSPQGAPSTTNRALTALVGWTWRHADDPLDLAEGIALQVQLGGASKQLLSDQNFVRTYFRYSQGFPLTASDALLFRGELGATFAPSSNGIPQDFLFRAGGTNSVRGYPYLSLGVKEGSAVVGGRYLMTMSAEYTHWISSTWGAAAFVDAGNAVDEPQAMNLAVGYGVGARWKSPAGPLGIDLAYGQRDGSLRFDFSLAIPF
ncbi:Surface antigen (D15) [Candidatus Accumulibacter aalborgensis]|uniref:Surface antigen (D15) n=1 Tax=Candidatus Accumulibacter aalborgensis TaxID=1860102 RepID=A0A1A8XTA5_9PROT|nr:autotransporter assembly complex family protein [Candidatus Accumulibacter aalborgensis]SBT08300.1 Surface antigen (D15) [Candidatus Accumulibacter aalborgensis]